MDDLSDSARLIFAIGIALALAALVHFIADRRQRRQRRKWRNAARRIPFIRSE